MTMAMTQEDIQQVLNAMKAESQGVQELETVTSLNGVNSLPGVKGEKVVNVPIELLEKPATDAAAKAETAASNATSVSRQAESSAMVAEGAAEEARKATAAAEEAAEKANKRQRHTKARRKPRSRGRRRVLTASWKAALRKCSQAHRLAALSCT